MHLNPAGGTSLQVEGKVGFENIWLFPEPLLQTTAGAPASPFISGTHKQRGLFCKDIKGSLGYYL